MHFTHQSPGEEAGQVLQEEEVLQTMLLEEEEEAL